MVDAEPVRDLAYHPQAVAKPGQRGQLHIGGDHAGGNRASFFLWQSTRIPMSPV